MKTLWLVVAALALAGGCTDYCEGDTVATVGFARADLYRDQLTACVQQHRCEPLCADVFQIDGQVVACTVTSVQHTDLTIQNGPAAATVDVTTLRGVNLHVVYVERVACSAADSTSWDDGGGDYDDGGDDGSCDDGSCDDGGDNGSGDDGSGGDDGGGDDGGGDDGGGDSVSAGGSARHR